MNTFSFNSELWQLRINPGCKRFWVRVLTLLLAARPVKRLNHFLKKDLGVKPSAGEPVRSNSSSDWLNPLMEARRWFWFWFWEVPQSSGSNVLPDYNEVKRETFATQTNLTSLSTCLKTKSYWTNQEFNPTSKFGKYS